MDCFPVETVLGVDLPCGAVDAGGGPGLLDPAVSGEALEGDARGFPPDAAGQSDAAGVGFDAGIDGSEGEAVQAVQDTAVARPTPARPSAGGGIGLFLQRTDEVGQVAGTTIEGGIDADASGVLGHEANRVAPLPGEGLRLFTGGAGRAAAAGATGSHVLKARSDWGELEQVSEMPVAGSRAQQHPVQHHGCVVVVTDRKVQGGAAGGWEFTLASR